MRSLEALRAWVGSAPPGTLAGLLDELAVGTAAQPPEVVPDSPVVPTWRALLWTVDPETRIGRNELLEAVGRPVSWLYRHTGQAAGDRIPHRKLDGQLVFLVGEVRRWLRQREEVVSSGPVDGNGPRHGTTTVASINDRRSR